MLDSTQSFLTEVLEILRYIQNHSQLLRLAMLHPSMANARSLMHTKTLKNK